MKVIKPGHVYALEHAPAGTGEQAITFVNREAEPHDGTLSQELLRANIDCMEVLIDRTNHCDACLPWPGNFRIIKALSEAQRQMRLALLFHEQRAMERKMEKHGVMPEVVPTAEDGHFAYPLPPPAEAEAKCEACGGEGYVCDKPHLIHCDHETPCPACKGTGKRDASPAPLDDATIENINEWLKDGNRIVPTECRLSDGTLIHQGDVLTVKGGVVCVNGVATRALKEAPPIDGYYRAAIGKDEGTEYG
jgi:hypothetical protein